MGWSSGDWIVRREVLPDTYSKQASSGKAYSKGVWEGTLVKVVEDSREHLISYIPEHSPLAFPQGHWPTPSGTHPWSNRSAWQGHGCLMIQRPEDAYAVWHFWIGPNRDFYCWYINLQEPFRRTKLGYDTQDLELDFLVFPNGEWQIKDEELLDLRVEEGRWTKELVSEIRQSGNEIAKRLESGERWWPMKWRDWEPDPSWTVPTTLPPGWHLP